MVSHCLFTQVNLFVMIPTGKCDRTVFKEGGVGKLTSLVYTQVRKALM
ncbi:hypothetical protein GXM_02662 [Nostoc sphaeroides CCNUC1]|uniref:Uncharacterized protein n=1 Tax=Nostoc sphaeroides CCNUC1 TaxID=2653204 RepID=A0A5P8VXP9_9NOSO|nr:hypothetical protein GXM_02662 [Nostoc sphaeroides CCNUC1]